MLFDVVLLASFWLYFYLVDDVTILSMDLCNGSQISQDPERLIELNRHRQLENRDLIFQSSDKWAASVRVGEDYLRVGALIFVFIGHEKQERVHTWNTKYSFYNYS